jgi:hypothetical protein
MQLLDVASLVTAILYRIAIDCGSHHPLLPKSISIIDCGVNEEPEIGLHVINCDCAPSGSEGIGSDKLNDFGRDAMN